jgi:hypothetical protein
MRLRTVALLVLIALASSVFAIRGSETLPAQFTDAEYWKIISEFSEPSGYFQHEIVTSNEISYQYVLPKLVQKGPNGRRLPWSRAGAELYLHGGDAAEDRVSNRYSP